MALLLNDEQTMLRDAARDFIGEQAPIAQLRKLRDSQDADGFSRDLWKGFAEMGFTGVLAPEAFGGSGLGHVETAVIMEEIGRNLTPSPFLSTAVLGVSALMRSGSPEQNYAYLPRIVGGDLLTALAVDEGPKHAPNKTALKAERAGNGFRLTGAKTFVVDGHVADLLIVAGRTAGAPGEREGLTLFLVDAKAEGLSTERTVMVDAHNAARLNFDGVTLDADAVLGEVDQGYAALESVLNAGRSAVAAEMVGSGAETFDRTVEYLKTRKQFGRAIGEFQALQHRAAHLYVELEMARATVMKAAQALDAGSDRAGPLVSIAKAKAAQAAGLAVREGVQMHGGMGMTDEVDIGLFMKRVRVAEVLFGDANFHMDRLARQSGY
ncbi:MAG: acyl-CoA dehydrogenase family protein [Caulobacteraceae bacterium]